MTLAVGYAVALWKAPDLIGQYDATTHHRVPLTDPKDRHNARLIVVSAGGAIVVSVSLLYTGSYWLSHHEQVTDRFTKALERLGSTDIDARLGGIYALSHVSHDSVPHHEISRMSH